MKRWKPPLRILVTGTRGKSTAVRYIYAALASIGISCSARLTGTIPAILDQSGKRTISRSSPAHISEMLWWLRNIPTGTEAAVAENSTVSPELQPLPCLWLEPDLVVWTSILPDHEEYWGPGIAGARKTLLKGVAKGSRVLLGPQASSDMDLVSNLGEKECILFRIHDKQADFHLQYETIARKSLEILGIPGEKADFGEVDRDPHDFRSLSTRGGGTIAWAFSSNDPATARILFTSLNWEKERTTLLFNHRKDRPSRLASHIPWMKNQGWKRVIVTGDRFFYPLGFDHVPLGDPRLMAGLVSEENQVFGCGNVRGLPLPSEVERS